MIKSGLILRLAEQNPHLYARDVEAVVNTILETITAALERGDRVELRGFGAFSVKHRQARRGRNPRSGAAVAVEAKTAPVFRPGKELRLRLQGETGGAAARPPHREPRQAASLASPEGRELAADSTRTEAASGIVSEPIRSANRALSASRVRKPGNSRRSQSVRRWVKAGS